jgi:hypothetical protein
MKARAVGPHIEPVESLIRLIRGQREIGFHVRGTPAPKDSLARSLQP